MEKGKCCEYCVKHEKPECPVKNAEPWSRWKNFCSEFEENEKAAMCDSEHIAPVVRRVDIATARVIWRIFTGLAKTGVNLFVYGILTPLLIITLILAMPYYALSKVLGVEIIDL
jgi:hypothetical protein